MHLLLEELELLDGKRRVLDALEVMIERVGTDVRCFPPFSPVRRQRRTADLLPALLLLSRRQIVPLLTQIAECVPQLWEKAANQEGEWLFKSSLLSLVTKMVDVSRVSRSSPDWSISDVCPTSVPFLRLPRRKRIGSAPSASVFSASRCKATYVDPHPIGRVLTKSC